MTVKLIRIDRRASKEEFVLDQFPVVIGRAEEAAVRVDSHWISRLHCQIVREDGRTVVRDLGSTMGTLVNLHEVEETELRHGDLLTVGPYTYRFVETRDTIVAIVRRLWHRIKDSFAGHSSKPHEAVSAKAEPISKPANQTPVPDHSQSA